jgi:N-acetylneuraminate synthase
MSTSKNSIIEIDGKKIGSEQPTYIVAEIGINHNGSIEIAKKLIDVAVEAKVDAVKFQKRDINSLYKEDVLKNPNIDSQGLEILLNVLNEVEFGNAEYEEIIQYCREYKITFLCTPWDKKSVDFLEKFNVPAYKIASADLTNFPLIQYLCEKKKPLIISTGMSTLDEIKKTVKFVKNNNMLFVLMHSNSTYPSPVELLNLNLIPELRKKFDVPVGYSGHESNIIPSVTAANLDAVMIERHITLDKTMEGLDQAASLEPDELKKLVEFVRESEKAKGKAIKTMTRGEILQREVLAKSLICSKEILENEVFSEDNIEVKGPAKGLSPQFFYEILGKKSTRNIRVGDFLQESDLE